MVFCGQIEFHMTVVPESYVTTALDLHSKFYSMLKLVHIILKIKNNFLLWKTSKL